MSTAHGDSRGSKAAAYCRQTHSYQYGFRPNRSTQEAVFDLTKFIYTGLNNKKLISTVCLDVCKAFDCINHEILLAKLWKISFSDRSIAWFKSYLTGTQIVRFNELESNTLSVKSGISQGTILGPLIFIFYINDIIRSIGTIKINMCADDCILFCSGNDWNIMKDNIQSSLENVNRWCHRNKLKLSNLKLKVLLFGSIPKLKAVDYSKTLHIGATQLDFVERYKYLGVTLDKHMTLTCLTSDEETCNRAVI